MNKVVLFLMAIVATLTVEAQINTPAPSPSSKLMQTVGLTEVTIDYSRPSMRGREVYGNLVPFDKLWRTGANGYTTITFNTDASIGGKDVKAGKYSIFTKPGASNWEVFFYTDIVGGGTPSNWDESKVVAQLSVPVHKLEMPVETFTITVDDVMNNGANIGIIWENTYVAVPFSVPTDAAVMQNIDKALNGPTANDYYAAAVYYSSEGKDINKAKEWMTKAMSMTEKPAFWQLRQQSLILAKAGDKKGAIEAAKKSLAGATEAGNNDYIKMNNDSLKEWGSK
ncbi:DUF2911 domain-containing protein [Maribacter hydrothermalis]|uniref:Dihydrolipoamide dehydrogenase n=1 Tax=Maribacter hydrothermalis TaxID=1836467 RepID=A0A1B7Z8X8_9FLAO|nr:DUF2911 domain-containing protein [Maribacter hydrothermalis]APQ18833.1 dihydrolipoamide dehydrogenase [Maribacter hydrothermalis]OBR39153.1 dihydrolipoamide dehydrogenase [Maribacter hydrothermalis]